MNQDGDRVFQNYIDPIRRTSYFVKILFLFDCKESAGLKGLSFEVEKGWRLGFFSFEKTCLFQDKKSSLVLVNIFLKLLKNDERGKPFQ